ncbi:Hypothetical protein NTJ_02183 [Nesidiocoris tenuis]|uniref:Uncharacterized protein n=1 Tax=Nesidiocoris tenuis TaxID=355587 RepID=A0ABN7AAN0_9HEMI|nr:Hypothetical protein NTJ_02183 [Nesidiocoris tenuis]
MIETECSVARRLEFPADKLRREIKMIENGSYVCGSSSLGGLSCVSLDELPSSRAARVSKGSLLDTENPFYPVRPTDGPLSGSAAVRSEPWNPCQYSIGSNSRKIRFRFQ